MRLLDLNKVIIILFFGLFFFQSSYSDDAVDIWKKNSQDKSINSKNSQPDKKINENKIDFKKTNSNFKNIEIDNTLSKSTLEVKLYGIFDPDQNNFDLNMWASSESKEIKKTLLRISKLNLSKTAENILINTLFSYSYLPKGMSDEEFLEIKIGWLIKNKKDDLLENFLNKNPEFHNKKKVIQYLVDKNISNANLKDGCKKMNFVSKEIKDSYLEKFKIYCLIFNKKNNQAQLLYDILKEQGKSDKFFDDKVNYLLGVTEKTTNKINDKNLLNFYLSSVTNANFQYEPDEKTKKSIWKYLNSANLIKVEDIEDKQKIRSLEEAANNNSLDKRKIFEIYKQIKFDINNLINAEEVYKNFDNIESRALIYQKFLISEKIESKLDLLFLLKDLFKKDKLSNIYTEFLSETLKNFASDEIPKSYKEVVERNIIIKKDTVLGKIKYNDKILHKSRVVRHFTESEIPLKKTQKDLNNVYKKIKRNKNYFFSAKDLVLVEALKFDGVIIPNDINIEEISKKYPVPSNLLRLVKNDEVGFLALKIVEIIGEDEVSNLDSETIYFITNLLNRLKLIKLRNEILISALPQRT